MPRLRILASNNEKGKQMTEDIKPKTGQLLKAHRMRATFNQKELAEKIGYTANYISNTETGERKGSSIYLATFAKTLHLTISQKAQLLDSVLN